MKMEVFSNPEFFQSLNKLMVQNGISIRTSYKLKTFKEQMRGELAKYEELRHELVDKYSNKDDKGEVLRDPTGAAVMTPENTVKFNKQFNELQKVEFNLGTKIKLSEIENVTSKDNPLKPQDLYILGDLVEE